MANESSMDRIRSAERFVERAIEAHRRIAAAQAAEIALLAEAQQWARSADASSPTSLAAELTVRSVAAQIGAGIRLADRTVQAQMDAATTLVELFPSTYAAWRDGRIDRRHVTVITDAGAGIVDAEARCWYERQVLERAATLTAAQLRPAATAIAEEAHPESLATRHERARERRRVLVMDGAGGMARLTADLPAVAAYGIADRLTQMARAVRDAADAEAADSDPPPAGVEPGSMTCETAPEGAAASRAGSPTDAAPRDSRTMDELRADIFADLLLTGDPHAHGDGLEAIAARVQVTVPVLTVLGESRQPCVLAGHGPIPVETALHLAGAASGWDRVMTSPVDGTVMAVDRYRPSEQLRRFLRARDENCRFVGCRMPVWRCDADHTVDAAHGGPTCSGNLASLCRRHHVLKHNSAWTVVQLGGGRLRWTSPGGRSYVDRPAPMVRFVSADDPPPF
ncbi:DUF222 domain-containing protein [Microbacterium sp. 179-B 1A2 NHS]|uniref:HNH endonuclease signature motif containing protein n=1 Tax=Microbacterium sp. 179-B 1A2 NHS TaxID=3142383 RepID=UPI0039A23AFC